MSEQWNKWNRLNTWEKEGLLMGSDAQHEAVK